MIATRAVSASRAKTSSRTSLTRSQRQPCTSKTATTYGTPAASSAHASAAKPATAPIPVQPSEPEFTAFILPHLSMPKWGPKCKRGYHRVFNLILWVLYTGMQWKCLPVPKEPHGKSAIHYMTVYKVFAKWANDGSLWQAFVASVRHLMAEKPLDTRVLHGDRTNTAAKGDGIGYSGYKHQPTGVLGLSAPSGQPLCRAQPACPWNLPTHPSAEGSRRRRQANGVDPCPACI